MTDTFAANHEWAVILGGSSGLGLATAHKLALHGMNICIVHRDRKAALGALASEVEAMQASGVEVLTYNIDATRADKRGEVIADLEKNIVPNGAVKVLVHSIARGNLKPMTSEEGSVLTTDDFKVTIEAMALSLYDWVQALQVRHLFAASARVISFTSEGSSRAWKYYAAVSAAKATLEAVSRSIALEYAPHGITSNCIQAGVTDTQSLRMIPTHEELVRHTLDRNPYRRLTTPQDVANVVYLLCRAEASWINGAVIPVDGGERIV